MTREQYEQKAQQCRRLMRDCYDPTAFEGLERLAKEYSAMAALLRNKERGDHPADAAEG
jgi:hypothetical protein